LRKISSQAQDKFLPNRKIFNTRCALKYAHALNFRAALKSRRSQRKRGNVALIFPPGYRWRK
jgi:hypothetical protein